MYPIYIINCTFDSNSGRGAIESRSRKGVFVYGCVFKNNNDIYAYFNQTLVVNNNIFIRTSAYSYNFAKYNFDFNLNYWSSNSPSWVSSWLVPDFDVDYDKFGEDYQSILTTQYLIYDKNGYVDVSNYSHPVVYTINGETIKGDTTSSITVDNDTYIKSVLYDKEFLYIGDSLSALQNIINKAPTGSTINLTRNYSYNPLVDSGMTKGVVINKTVYLDGKGYTVNGCGVSRIFNITANNVVLNNINLINGSSNYGGSVYWSGSSGIVNKSVFYNNTASLNGSAIYSINSIDIYNSEFLDNTAHVDFSYELTSNGFIVHFVNYDNYYNSIYARFAPSMVSNVTYYWGRKQSNDNLVGSGDGFNLSVVLSNKATLDVIDSFNNVTDNDGNFTVVFPSYDYYGVDVRHYTGSSKFSDLSFEFAYNVTVTNLELFAPDEIIQSNNLTVVALVNSSATGSVTFTINGTDYVRDVVDGRAVLIVDPNLGVGVYDLVAVYNPDSSSAFTGQRNTTTFNVKVAYSPIINIVAPETVVNGTEVTIKAISNFKPFYTGSSTISWLQLVVRL